MIVIRKKYPGRLLQTKWWTTWYAAIEFYEIDPRMHVSLTLIVFVITSHSTIWTFRNILRFIILVFIIYHLRFPPNQNWTSGSNHKNCSWPKPFSASIKLKEKKFKKKSKSMSKLIILKAQIWSTARSF